MVSAADLEEGGYVAAAHITTTSTTTTTRRRRVQQFVGALALVGACCAVLVIITNVHHHDVLGKPVELAASAKAAAKIAAARKPASVVAKQAQHPAVQQPPSTEERIESVLRKNLDRTAESIAKQQLQPLLISQGQQVLHSAKSKVAELRHGGDGVRDTDGTQGDLHSALMKQDSSEEETEAQKHPHAAAQSEEDRTESALRKQLDMDTSRKEKEMFQNALKMVHAQLNGSTKKSVDKLHSFSENDEKKEVSDSGVPQSQRNEEDALKAQLEASVKAKQKAMYSKAFKDWLEKQQSVKYHKAKKEVTIASREDQLFKKTLAKAKEEGPELAKHLKEEEQRDMTAAEKKAVHKPSFSTWLKAFKAQLAHRTREASKKIAEARYNGKKGKTGKIVHEAPVVTLKAAAEKRERAERAVKELQKSLKLEEVEEKAVSRAEDKETTPGKALALLKKTMKKEREALKEISRDEKGVGADPNIAALAPKPAKPKAHNSGILGLDDLSYY